MYIPTNVFRNITSSFRTYEIHFLSYDSVIPKCNDKLEKCLWDGNNENSSKHNFMAKIYVYTNYFAMYMQKYKCRHKKQNNKINGTVALVMHISIRSKHMKHWAAFIFLRHEDLRGDI